MQVEVLKALDRKNSIDASPLEKIAGRPKLIEDPSKSTYNVGRRDNAAMSHIFRASSLLRRPLTVDVYIRTYVPRLICMYIYH